jgi:hypothetical protein
VPGPPARRRRGRERQEGGQALVGRLVEVIAADDGVALVEGELDLQFLAELLRDGREVGRQDDEGRVVGVAHAMDLRVSRSLRWSVPVPPTPHTSDRLSTGAVPPLVKSP